ncbi:MAG: CPBP family intramembrane glutamic endopeptidase [Candidatus Diapherotrites archaeon]
MLVENRRVKKLKESFVNSLQFFSKLGFPLLWCFIIAYSVVLIFYIFFNTNVENVSEVGYNRRYVFIVILAAPILEEILFRGIILKYTKKILEIFKFYWAETGALMFSSFIFGMSHTLGSLETMKDIGVIAATFFIGIILGKHYLKEGLVSVMWLHGLYNLLVFLVLYSFFWVSI